MKKFIMCLLTALALNITIYAKNLKELELSINEDKTKAIKIFESTEDIDFKNVVFEDFEKYNFKYSKDNIIVDRIIKEDKKEQQENLSISNVYKILLDKNIAKKLNNQEINITLVNSTKLEIDISSIVKL